MKYFTIIGNHDAIDPKQPGFGAALTIFFHYKDDIDAVYIFSSPDKPNFSYTQTAEKIRRRMQAEKKDLSVSIIEMDIESPVDFDLVYKTMLDETQTAIEKDNIKDDLKIINITSGTPTMSTCWVLLQKSGLISNAKLVQSFEPRFQQKYGKTCQEVDLDIDDFPEINTPSKEKRALNRVNRELKILKDEKSIAEKDDTIPKLIGKSKLIRDIKEQIIELIDKETHVLILGEPGTGKDVVAKAIWDIHRKDIDRELNVFDSGTFSDELILSELFGHIKGAFTGANQTKTGIVEQCDGKMLYLDEIGNISLKNQSVFLRFLQFGEWKRVGDNKINISQIQVVAATNMDIYDKDIFRPDLKDRFHEIIKLPALRERKSDIPFFIDYFLNKVNKNVSFDRKVYEQLKQYAWPGNVRQLEMWIERICRKFKDTHLTWDDIPEILKPNDKHLRLDYDFPELPFDANDFITKLRLHALEVADGNKAKADRLLGLKDGTMKQWMFQRDKKLK
ncbi:MAG: sigma 54-interacting transcriptional regulator, partial [Candidatus Marinimicrobia bacterium]|nr:sigma 54-interacting transcriptional regulator [Candidatus Neomarinimicrobiota bacterium]